MSNFSVASEQRVLNVSCQNCVEAKQCDAVSYGGEKELVVGDAQLTIEEVHGALVKSAKGVFKVSQKVAFMDLKLHRNVSEFL